MTRVPTPVPCPECGEEFQDLELLLEHVDDHGAVSDTNPGP